MNLRELYNLIEMIPEAGLQYIVNRLVPPNELTKDEKSTLASWITKKERLPRIPIVKEILLMLDPANIRWIDNPTEEESLKVVYESPYLIEYVADPSENVQLAAVKNTAVSPGRIFKLISVPVRGVWIEVIKEQPSTIVSMDSDDLEYQLTALEKKPDLISNKTVAWVPEARHFAFSKDLAMFPYVDDPTEEECWTALHYDHKMIQFIPQPTPEMKAFSIIVA